VGTCEFADADDADGGEVDDDGEGGEEALSEGRTAVKVGTGLEGLKAGGLGEFEVGGLGRVGRSAYLVAEGEEAKRSNAIGFGNANDRNRFVCAHQLRHLHVRTLRADNKKDVD
jgi:hypothetical protein